MRFLQSLLFLILFSNSLVAQDAYLDALFAELETTYNITGGKVIMQDSEEENVSATVTYGNINATVQTSDDNPFKIYHSIMVNGEGTNPWDAGLSQRNINNIAKNDNVLVAFWIRGTSDEVDPKVNFFVEDAMTFEKELFLTLDLKEEWTQYLIPYKSIDLYTVDHLAVGLHLAYGTQLVEYGGVTLINYKNEYSLQDLPTKQGAGPYDGFADDAPWRAEADTRIDKYRKADMKIKFTDGEGTPLKQWDIKVKMKRHEFEFGTAVNASLFADNANRNTAYEQKLENIDGKGNGFNAFVFENALKWRAWEGEWPTDKTGKYRALDWLAGTGATVRGHNLLWPGWDVLPDRMELSKDNPTYLVNQINSRINTMLNDSRISTHIRDWDVINEIAVIRDIENALKGTPGYETGREIYAEVFKQVKQIDPGITTYLNDYITIGSNRDSGELYDDYKKFIKEIQDAGGDIDGIGFQAHIGGSPTAPQKVYDILEDFYQTFGTEAKITEYDTDRQITGDVSKKYMEDFLTIILSHQSVKGFLMWGFWDGAHWKDNAPMFNLDWTIKPAGEAFIDKVYNEWWVDETIRLDEEGYLNLRPFKGDYEFYLEETNETFEFKLTGDTTATIVGSLIISTSEVDFDEEFALFPNPAEDFITLSNKSNQDFDFTIVDLTGRQLYQGKGYHNYQLDMSNQMTGVYLVHVKMANRSFTKKIFKH